MLIDLHMHEMTYSKDSFLQLDQMVEIAKEKGLDGICITDHDSMGLVEVAREYTERTGFPIFVGIEFFSLQGDIVAFGIKNYPPERVDAQEFIDLVNAQGGICFSAHPFRNNNRGLGHLLQDVKGLHGVEVLNGSTLLEANRLAQDYALKLGLIQVGASDCHIPEKVGVYATYFAQDVNTIDEFVAEFKTGNCRAAYYKEGTYYIVDGKL